MKSMLILPLCALAALSQPAFAETRLPASQAEISLSFAPLVKATAPAVVNIYARRIVEQRQSPFANDPFFSQFFGFGQAAPRVQNSLGSGVILRADGIVVSNYHVVGGADTIRVVLSDRREFDGRVILSDPGADIAVIQLEDASGLPALDLADSDRAEVGDLVLAIGNPFGVGQTVTSGIVSGLARSGGGMGQGGGYFIQTDAPINPGNSGGALIDMTGRVLGINSQIVTRSGGSNGIGFAIPANLVRQYVSQAEAGRTEIERPWSGIEVQVVDAAMAEAMGMPAPRGVVITRLHPESPFAHSGLQTGDVITSVGGLDVDGPQELEFRLTTMGTGGTAPVAYWRDGRMEEADVTLSPAPVSDAQSLRITANTIFDGLSAAILSPALIQKYGLPLSAEGIIVTGVGGAARGTRLQSGDVILAINGVEIRSLRDLEAVASQPSRRWQITFVRDGQRLVLRLRG
ncbi:trypsin-like peptidase domain-containing protein [Albidovulum sediminicola]|uniref:Trypsin-like peptidase domain-containing protein n=1 Tax=Albidovulum sediminicola TaxID=2984331 RepID=A0ABT2Z1R3_9RHOB|nr:trypsin-like peptidase domain-containing protein [Defluviimonas sp. WL0075]MCV2865078.1 trypsin-like peptidase domain-containing protein [Defluviimonas sp. WL0075]